MVSAAPTSTTNITGFFNNVAGFSLTKDSFVARATISGSKSGRERASLWGNSELVSVWTVTVGGCSKVDGMILAPDSCRQKGKQLAILH